MPTVPRYNDQQVQTRGIPTVTPGAALPAGAAGGGPAGEAFQKATSQLIEVATKFAAEETIKADNIALVDFDAKATALETSLLYDPQNGALNKRGRDALGSYDGTRKAFEDGSKELLKGLSGGRQRAAAEQLIAKRWASVDRTLQVHIAKERERHGQEVAQANISNQTGLAVVGRRDDAVVLDAFSRATDALDVHASNTGMSREGRIKAQEAMATDFHTKVIGAFASESDYKGALEYLNKWEKTIEPSTRAKLAETLDKKAKERTALDLANAAISIRDEYGNVKRDAGLAFVTEKSKSLGFDADQTAAAQSAYLRSAHIEDVKSQEFLERRNSQYLEDVWKLVNSQTSEDDALRILEGQGAFVGVTPEVRQRRMDMLFHAFAKSDAYFDAVVNTKERKLAWEEVKILGKQLGNETMTDSQGNEIRRQDAYLLSVKSFAPGHTADEILDFARKQLEDQVKSKVPWASGKKAYEATYEQEVMRAAGVARLKADPRFDPADVERASRQIERAKGGAKASAEEIVRLLSVSPAARKQ